MPHLSGEDVAEAAQRLQQQRAAAAAQKAAREAAREKRTEQETDHIVDDAAVCNHSVVVKHCRLRMAGLIQWGDLLQH